jgi:hypothetical protein
MRVIGIAMMKNEEDVADHVVRHMLAHDLDLVVVADNMSTDDTREILSAIERDDRRLVVVDDKDPAYHQSEKMTALAERWAEPGDWVVPFDADELWEMDNGRTLAGGLRLHNADIAVGYPWVHVPRWDDPMSDCPFQSMPNRVTSREVWPKAALRWAAGTVIEQGNHWTKSRMSGILDIRHFQYRSYDHLSSKVRNGAKALELANLPANSGTHWRHLSSIGEVGLATWWNDYVTQPVVLDPPRCRA